MTEGIKTDGLQSDLNRIADDQRWVHDRLRILDGISSIQELSMAVENLLSLVRSRPSQMGEVGIISAAEEAVERAK